MERKFGIVVTVVSMVFANISVAVSGLRMPWDGEAAFYAVYGASAGVCAAITVGTLVVWAARKSGN
jgi:hypothetical protein